jgi:hypothetical protein
MRSSVLAAVLAAALPAAAQEPPPAPASPPDVSAAPSAPAPAAPPGAPAAPAAEAPPPAVPAGPRTFKGWELDLSGWAGPYSGRANEAAAGGFDVTLLVRGDLFAIGARETSEKLAAAFASNLAVVAGALVPLSARTRLDLLADAGVGLHMIPKDGMGCSAGTLCHEREGANEIRPALGARAGFTFLSGDGRVAFTLGAFGRFVPERDVALQRRTCAFSSCTASTETRTVGGKVFGGFLGIGFPRRFE